MILSTRLLRTLLLAFSLALVVRFVYLRSNEGHARDGFFRLNPLGRGGGRAMDYYVKSSYVWGDLKLSFPPESITPLPTGIPKPQPRIQFDFQTSSKTVDPLSDSRQLEVRRAFQKCWSSYRKYAWMKDEVCPLSGQGKDTFGGWGATLVDSLDTLWIMGLHKEFKEAIRAVARIDFAKTDSTSANTFETTIRYLGGLLSAYDLSKEEVLLLKAIEIGDLLYAGFDTPNHLPGFWIDYKMAKSGKLTADNHLALASPGTLSLEFTRLSQVSGNPKYYDAITRITTLLEAHQNSTLLPGMWPIYLDLREINFRANNFFSLGGDSDSAYEYLPKMHALLGGLDPLYAPMAKYALETIKSNLLFRPMTPNSDDILFAGKAGTSNGKAMLDTDVEHLSCFAGGMFALSGRLFEKEEYVEIGAKLTKGCTWAYDALPTGIMPEIASFMSCASREACDWDEQKWERYSRNNLPKGITGLPVPYYILRPEAIESVFIMYRITGRKEYQDIAWKMFKSIMAATETAYGNAAIDDVNVTGGTSKRDSMESFWLAETLKYFYLIFSPPDLISLDEYVFNTEAHPLERLK